MVTPLLRVGGLFCLLAAASPLAGRAEESNELGRPLFRNYPPGDHLYHPQSQTLAQDAAGWIYFGNGVDLLAFDGGRWTFRRLPSESAGIRQFATAADGTIYAGGASVLGFLRGAGEKVEFVSLADRLPEGARNIDEIRFVAAAGDAAVFADAEKILVWRAGRFVVHACAAASGRRGARLHEVGGKIFVSAEGWPLRRLEGDALAPVVDDPLLRDETLVAVTEGSSAGTLTVLTAERGFWEIDATQRVRPLDFEANRWLKGRKVFRARRLADGSWVVAFAAVSKGGGLRISADGRAIGPLGFSMGMYTDEIRDFVPDREGGLWLGLDAGAMRMEWPSPATIFDVLNGLGHGAVRAVARHEGVLHAQTDEGLFRLRPAGGAELAARFERVSGEPAPQLRVALEASKTARGKQWPPHWPVVLRRAVGEQACAWEEPGTGGGVLWIGGSGGLLRVDLSRSFPRAPSLALRLEASGVNAGEELGPEHQPMTFRFLAIRQQRGNRVSYRTRLVGLEQEWSSWSEARERYFAHVGAGSYVFQVQARDEDGVTSEVATLAFVVRAPWWLTGWAFAGYAIAVAGLVVGSVKARTRSLERRAAELERVIAQRTEELERKNRELTRLHQLEFDEKVAARLAEEKARLEVLRYQLNPHFLFNTLASISASLPQGPSVGRAMVERLAEFCRLTLHRGEHDEWTTLGDEMRLLRSYLAIEQSRWGELLEIEVRHDSALDEERLPYFLLLPLVENALKYGQATSPDRVGLRLVTRRADTGGFEIEIANTGEWIEPSAKKSVATLGIGLENLRQRLARTYRGAHGLDFSAADGWVVARLRLPAGPRATVAARPL